jgi:hypothetical protein
LGWPTDEAPQTEQNGPLSCVPQLAQNIADDGVSLLGMTDLSCAEA